jgi:hypothetical protein
MDKRKNNGGNSTKTTGVDKRKNAYRDAVEEAITPKDIIEVLRKFKELFIDNEDIQAGRTVLEYCVTKPTESLELNATIKEAEKIGVLFKKSKE